MYHPPEEFVEKLDREFRGRLRVRWSRELHEWHIEQHVKRGLFPGTKPSKKGWDETTDAYIRHRDGYSHVMAVRTGTKMNCRKCNMELSVPYMETHFVGCSYCKLRGYTSTYAVVFFPLGDSLIDYLKRLDPENPISERLAEDLDRQNDALANLMERNALADGYAAASDNYNRIVGIPSVSLGGKTPMWQR